jgi:PAS domain S-box-containing protein
MKKDKLASADAAKLRRRAEARLRTAAAKGGPVRKEAETQRIVHELQVHQIELAMQNEELRRSRAEVETGLERYTKLYDFAPVSYLTLGRDGTIIQVNLTGARLLGVERARLKGRHFKFFVCESDRSGFQAFLEKVFASQAKEQYEVALKMEGKGPLNVYMTATASLDGRECRVIMEDITQRKRIEDAQWFVLRCGWPTSGEDFFEALARYLAETLEMDYVCIDRLEGDGLAARTVAVYFDGKFDDNLVYALKDTPCGDVVEKTICSFSRGVRHLFPRDAALQEMMAESYVGTTLWSSRGQPIGLIAVIGRQARKDLNLAEAILKVVSIRAAGELERRQAEAETQRLASFPMLNPNPIIEADEAGHVHFCNPAAERMLPAICLRQPDHPWLSDWESVMRNLREEGSTPMVREVPIGEKWYQQTIHFVEDARRVRIYGLDITGRKRIEEAINRKNTLQTGINRIFNQVLIPGSEAELGKTILSVAEELTGSRLSFIAEIAGDGNLREIAIRHSGRDRCAMIGLIGHRHWPGNLPTRGLFDSVLKNGKSLLCNNPSTHPDSFGVPEGHPVIGSFLAVPLTHAGGTMGMIGVANREGGYRKEEQEDLESLAFTAVQALRHQKAERQVKAALKEKEVLLQEIHHRVKNNMQVVRSLLNLQASTIKDPKMIEHLRETGSRVNAMAIVHETLYQSESLAEIDLGTYLKSLTTSIARIYEPLACRISVSIEAEPVLLGIDQTVPCGLILNELISNAYKHAFPNRSSGEIRINAALTPDHEIALMVSDNGVGLLPGFDARQTRTLGFKLIFGLVESQLDGTFSIEGGPGSRFTILFPRKKMREIQP